METTTSETEDSDDDEDDDNEITVLCIYTVRDHNCEFLDM